MYRTLLALLFLAFATGCASQQESDYDKLQGSWQAVAIDRSDLVALNIDFPPAHKDASLTTKLHFSGDQCTDEMFGTSPHTVTYSLNTEKSPREILMKVDSGSYARVGIYKLEGDRRLTLVFHRTGDTQPMEFKSDFERQMMCMTFEKISDTVGD